MTFLVGREPPELISERREHGKSVAPAAVGWVPFGSGEMGRVCENAVTNHISPRYVPGVDRTTLLYEKVDYCPVVHGGCGEPLAWTPRLPPGKNVETPDDGSAFLEATCGSCGHVWSLPPGVGIDR